MTLDSTQVVPVKVDVAIPVDGETVTASLPLRAEMTVRVQLVDDTAAQPAAFPALTVEDAALLLVVLSEMPTGFFQTGEPQPVSSNQDIAAEYHDPAAFLTFLDEEIGRQGGFYVQFGNGQYAPLAGGNGSINAIVLVMSDAAGADRYLSGAMERELKRSDEAEAVYRLSAPRLGDNSVLYKVDATDNDTQVSNYSLWVRVNNVVLSLDGYAMRNLGDVDQLLTVARTILARGLGKPAQETPLALTVRPNCPQTKQRRIPSPAR